MSTFRRAAPPERPAEKPTQRSERSPRPARTDRPASAPHPKAHHQPTSAPTARTSPPKPRMRPRTVDRTKPVAASDVEGERLSKRVMQLKGCSRKEAEQYIEGGWVMVGGVVVEDPPFRVLQQTVTIAPDASLLNLHDVTIILNKPPGYLDGVEDDDDDVDPPQHSRAARGHKPAARSARALLTHAKRCVHDDSGIRPLKRHLLHLEADVPLETGASGLVVFTQDWRTTRKLSEDIQSMEHELIADVKGEVSPEALQKMARALHDERNPLPHTKFSVNSSTPELSKLRFAIKGAHPGLVAYLCERAGLQLLALRRIRLGRVALSDLPVGQWRYLAAHEKF